MRNKRPSNASAPSNKRIRLASPLLENVRLPDAIAALPHVMKNIGAFTMEPSEVLLEAAQNGNLQSIRSILAKWEVNYEHKMEAAVAAATQGHPNVVLELLEVMDKVGRVYSAWEVLDEACYKGHLNVVEAVAKYANEFIYHADQFEERKAWEWGYILTNAVIGGNMEVVRFLLSVDKWHLDIGEAFEQALHDGKAEMAEMLQKVYSRRDSYDDEDPQCGDEWDGDDLLIQAAACGYLRIVKHYSDQGHTSSDVLNDAFTVALSHPKLMNFLYCKGCITSRTLEKTFIHAARRRELDSLKFLYDLCCIVPKVVNEAFTAASASCIYVVDVLKYLYGKGCITPISAAEAFGRAAYKGDVDAVKFLRSKCGVPSKVINAVFVDMAARGRIDVLRYLNELDCIAIDSVKSAFLGAARHDKKNCVEFLYTSRLKFAMDFIKVAHEGEEDDVAELLRRRTNVSRIPASVVKEGIQVANIGDLRNVQIYLDSRNHWISEARTFGSSETNRFLEHVLGISNCESQ